MKKKIVLFLRSGILLVILFLALVSTPFEVFGSGDSMVAVRGIRRLVQATWIAIGWIAIETAWGWFMALRKPKVAAKEPPVKAPPVKEPTTKEPPGDSPSA
jgi:hypothetical protein